MNDLNAYLPVSTMPPVTRDLSVVLDHDTTDDDIGDIVREALGDDADIVELVQTLSATGYDDLSEQVRARLGMTEGQKNILLRVVLRSLNRTLTSDECNIYRDRIYQSLHQGTIWQWATKT